jgi:hypothetical protein
MPRHEDMDYHHTRWHCDDCWDAYVQEKRHRELVEAMERSTGVEKIEVTRQFIPTPNKTKEQQSKGGISLEPRRKDIG